MTLIKMSWRIFLSWIFFMFEKGLENYSSFKQIFHEKYVHFVSNLNKIVTRKVAKLKSGVSKNVKRCHAQKYAVISEANPHCVKTRKA